MCEKLAVSPGASIVDLDEASKYQKFKIIPNLCIELPNAKIEHWPVFRCIIDYVVYILHRMLFLSSAGTNVLETTFLYYRLYYFL